MPVQRVVLVAPRGFCAGVEMAIKALAWMVRVLEPPIYCFHEIVHNQLVVEAFSKQGVIFVNDISEVPVGAPIMLSAHGSAPSVVSAAGERGGVHVNAVCPLVSKVHHELKVRASKGYTVLYVGHEGHDEAIGTMAVAPDAVRLLLNEDDVDALEAIDTPVALLAQTTLAHDEWNGILEKAKERFPDLWMPARSDLCFATTNRQAAVRAIAEKVDVVVVVGSQNSSNTMALKHTAEVMGAPRVIRINSVEELPTDISGVVGITAGASVPDDLVHEIVNALAPAEGVEEIRVTDEDEYFPLPRELRELNTALVSLVRLAFGAPDTESEVRDRDTSATDVLKELATV